MLIKAKTVFRHGSNLVTPGATLDVPDNLAKRLICLKAAEEVLLSQPETARKAPPDENPNGNTPEDENGQEGPENGEIEGAALEDMSLADLKAYAQELGIETGKIRSKAAMIEAISAYAEDGIPADDLPDLSPQDVVDE